MSKSKHTPGPWTVATRNNVNDGTEGWLSIVEPVEAGVQKYVCILQGEPTESMKQNAALIAAAPDMLAMLEYLHEKIDAKPGTYEFDAVKALIAKARGEK